DKKTSVDVKNQYESVQNTPNPTVAGQSTEKNVTTSAETSIVYSNRPLLGVNGTGQRKDMSDKLLKPSSTIQTDTIKTNDGSESDTKKNINQFPKKVGASATLTKAGGGGGVVAAGATLTASVSANASVDTVKKEEETEEEKIIDTVDVPENETLNALKKNNLTVNQTEDHHHYYNSTIVVDKEKAETYWNEIRNMSPNYMLSQSHRRAMIQGTSF
ncbi:hypothetical protein DOY81_015430, partial [Sarcophaga bullata]